MSPREVLASHDASELAEWMAFDRFITPLDNSWLQTGVLANVSRAGPSRQPGKPTDYIPVEKIIDCSDEHNKAELFKALRAQNAAKGVK